MRSKFYWLAVTASSTLLVSGLAAPAGAQTAPPDTSQSDNGNSSKDIVVTAQKRNQHVSDIPISISAVSGETLDKMNITQSDQLVAVTPGLAWGGATGKSKPAIFLRGIGVDDYHSTTNSPIGTYSDGAYMGNSFGYGQLILDVDRVEVLRGPQGTLWGKNTTGGVINYVPQLAEVGKPANMTAEMGVSNYGTYQGNVAIGTPVTDNLAVRVSAGLDQTDGYFTSTTPGTDYHQGGSRWWGLRGSIAYEPQSNIKIVGEINYSDLAGQAPPLKSLGTFDPSGGASFTPCASPTAGRLGTSCGDYYGYVSSPNPYSVAPSSGSAEAVKTFAPIVKMQFGLGDYTLNTLSAYTYSARHFSEDADFVPSTYEWNFFDDEFRSFSQEIRLSSPASKRLSWITGLYAYGDKSVSYNTTNSPDFSYPQTAGYYTNKSQSYGAFADATYHVTDKLNVTLGLRYTRDQREARGELIAYNGEYNGNYSQANVLANNLGILTSFNPGTSRKDNDLSGRAVIDYHIAPKFMVYASISRGFKGGDLNSGAQNVKDFYITGPEHLLSYEAGMKGTIIPGILSTETGAFYYNYTDAQVYIQTYENGFYYINLANAGKVQLYGFDGNLNITPTHRLELDLNYAYLHSVYKSYVNTDASVDYTGNVTPFASKWQLIGRLNYNLPLGRDMSLDASVNATYKTKFFFTGDNLPEVSQSGYVVADASLALNVQKNLRITAWVKNFTKTFYWVGGYSLAEVGSVLMMPGAPRTFGGSVRYSF